MTKDSTGRHGGNRGKTDRNEAEQDKQSRSEPESSLSGARDRDEREGHTSGKD
jgi:hypothetical protein